MRRKHIRLHKEGLCYVGTFCSWRQKKKIILLMTRHIVFLCYVVALVKCKQAHSWKVVTESIHQADYEYVLRPIRDSEDWKTEIMRYSTWQRGYLNTSSSSGISPIIQREEAHSFPSAPDMGQFWKAFCTNEANVVSHRETKQQLLSQPQNQLYLNEWGLEGSWVHGQQRLLKSVTPSWGLLAWV